jgi:CMP-2-keto-3-deoxyoctulosonic acid synthetase
MLWFIDVGEVRGRCDQWILSLAAVGEDVVKLKNREKRQDESGKPQTRRTVRDHEKYFSLFTRSSPPHNSNALTR